MEVWCRMISLATLLFQAIFCDGLEVRISTDPPGPQYPAAVWVRFSCNVYNHPRPESFSYHWKATCNNTGQVQFTMSNPDGSDFVWVQSTPPFCQDYLECTATDDTGSSTSAGKLISGITGVGMSIPTHILESVSNRSAVVVTHSEAPTSILCHSSLKGIDGALWISPSGNVVPEMSGNRSNSFLLVHTYANLSLADPLVANENGVYACAVPNENKELQTLHVGVFNSFDLNATLVSMEYHMTPSSVFLNCITSGLLPTTVLWSKDCAMLSQNITTQRLTNPATALYSNILSWDTSGGENLRGMYSCNVYMDWVTADNSRSGRERVSGKFAIYNVGEKAVLECVFAEDVKGVELLYGNQLMVTNTSHKAMLQMWVEESLHNKTYLCRGNGPDATHLVYFTFIVQVPENAISIHIEKMRNTTQNPNVVSLNCCAMKTVQGLSSNLTVVWYGPNEERHLASSMSAAPVVTGNKTCVELQLTASRGNVYVCKATLPSPAMEQPLVKTATYRQENESTATTPTQSTQSKNIVIIITHFLSGLITATVILLVVGGVILLCLCWKKKREDKKHTNKNLDDKKQDKNLDDKKQEDKILDDKKQDKILDDKKQDKNLDDKKHEDKKQEDKKHEDMKHEDKKHEDE